MSTIGNRTVNLHTVDRDETIYMGALNTLSHKDLVALRRTLSTKPENPLRTNIRFERGFAVGDTEKSVTVSLAFTVPPGAVAADVTTFVNDTLTQAASIAGSLAVTGDIHLA
ncbi:TPA_asm: coat protein [ssRNA phage SRR5466727_5]|uniref:Coat protein n=1 Tax=ssRNA phage SRR5466727_5 TaxID=2786434 RepID=A0A8S5L5E0_9VIRU|nr:coat protein [ssRNA phage SRR5466727_5]DAD52458.1 TPA_asm: coat protein [ssRNA phage SRR5466727_5]